MPACKPDTLAYRTLLAALGAAAFLVLAGAAAARAQAPGVPAAAPFKYWNPEDTAAIPATLSAMGIYQGAPGAKAKLIPQAYHFEVNSPLWSDDAKKQRWVLVPAGKSIGFREKDDYWDYPDSAVFIKQFAIDTITGDSASRVLWETRVLLNHKGPYDAMSGRMTDNWYGYSYKWDADQKDARLVPAKGLKETIRVWPNGIKKPSLMKKWVFPRRSDCDHCHHGSSEYEGVHARSVLGFFTAQLNRPHPDSAGINQLDYFFTKGLLHGQKPYPWDYSPRWRAIEDNSASVDIRARSYIAANCSGCHGTRGILSGAAFGMDLNYDFHAMEPKMEFRYRPIGYPYGMDTIAPFFYPKNDPANPDHVDTLRLEPALLVPGYPEKSLILFRQRAKNDRPDDFDSERAQMPPLARFEVNTAATALIEKWIKEMPVPVWLPAALRKTHRLADDGIRLQGKRVMVAAKWLDGDPAVSMLGVDGRQVDLRKVAAGAYAVPDGLPKGLYFIRVGSRKALRYLF